MLKKRNLLLAATAAFALQFTAKANDIEPGKEYYTAIKAPNPIVLDGDLSEWEGAQLLADPRFAIPKGSARDGDLVFFEEYNGGSWTDPDDQTSAVQVVYDDDNVYFGFTVTDDYHENAANSAWNGDSVQLMIANETRDQQIALYNYALGGIEGETGDIIVNHEAGPAAAADADQTEAVIVRNEETKRTYYEIKLPKSTLGLDELKGGVRFGLGMAINDGDEDTPGQKGWGGLGAHSIVFGKSPEETAVVTLATSNDIEPGKEFYIANPVPGALDTKTGTLGTSAENPIVLDGDLGEWTGVPVLADPRFSIPKGSKRDGDAVLFEEYNGGSWTGPDDQTSAVRIAYDADNVYFGFVVTDDYHENAANSAWNGDSIQLMIANANQDQQVALYNYALGGIENETGDIIVNHEAGPAAAADAEPTEAVVVRDERTKRTTYEIKLPKSSLGLETLELGTQFGLGMAINDGDEDTPGQKGWGGLGAHSIVFGKSPEETALVTLGVGSGNPGGIFISAPGADIDSFFFRANDNGDSVVDPASGKLILNGQEVALEVSDKKVDAYDFTYSVDGRFDPGTTLNYVIEVSDTLGKKVSDSGSITTPAYGLLLATMLASDVDTSKPGFNFKVWQSDQYNHGNNLVNVEALLDAAPEVDGATIDNDAYSDEAGPASGAGDLVGHMMHYEIPTVINLNGYANQVDLGNFQPDDVMPGIPGNFGYYDGIAAEITTFIEFPTEGLVTMGVNSDDGFQLTMGAINDKVNATIAAKAAGVSDTTFIVDVREPGIYPVRIVYYSQGGDAGIELYTEDENGEKTLVNADGGLKAYRVGVVNGFIPPDKEFNSTPVAQGGDLSEPTVVNFGELDNQATYEFFFNAVMDGASTAIAGNNAFAIKLDQWNNQGVFGTTEFGVADNLFEAVDGQSVASVFGEAVHVVITTNADGSNLYINGVLSGTWGGNFTLSGDTKVMGARLEQATDHMGAGSMMYKWATYTGAANASDVQSLFDARPSPGPSAVILPLDGLPDAGSGLDGRYWQAAPASVPSLAEVGLNIIHNWTPNGTFTATGLSFQGGNDLTTVQDWLQDDGASYVGTDGNMDDGVLSFTGYIRIDSPGTVDIRSESDDGSIIWIAGEKVVDNDGSHGAPGPSPDGSYNFEAAGLYPIEIAWFNGDWTSDAGDHGGANLNILAGGNAVPGEILYSASDVNAAAIGVSSLATEAGDAGLHGAYWTTEPKGLEFGEGAQGPIFQTVPGDDHGLMLMATPPQGRFISTDVNYTGDDLTPILDWLGNDGGSFVGEAGNFDDGLLQFKGFINITEAGQHSFNSSSDDGSVVRIGNQVVVNNDGGHGAPGPAPDGNAFFPVAGLYPIEVAWFNGDWTSADGAHGGANINLTMDGASLAGSIFQPLGGLPPVGPSANIAFVSFHETDEPSAAAADAGMTEAADIGYTDALKAAGHTVTRILTSGSPDVELLNTFDLVIISRSVSSGGYSSGDSADAWNSVSSPMLVLGGYVLRTSRMGYTDGTTMVDTADTIQLRAEDASHPLFSGVDLNDGVTGDFAGIVTWNDQVQRGVSINNNNAGEAGRVIATVATESDPTAGGIVAIEYDAGAPTTTGGNFAGKRMALLTGSREAGGVTSETAGIWDLTDVGRKIYLNAVSYLTAGGSGGGISGVSLADGMLTIEYSGTLKSAGSVTGPFNAVDGASSPYTVAADQAAQFFIAE